MKSAAIPNNEAQRLAELYQYDVLDTLPEASYDQLTELASSLCNKPIALVSLVDEKRQWFKSHHGTQSKETPRDLAFCAHAILQDNVFEIQDSRKDPRFQDNPLVTGPEQIVFYAGAPLISDNGHKLGTLCVIDNKPSALTEHQKQQLAIIANQVVTQLELRKALLAQQQLLAESKILVASLATKNHELEQFVYAVSHDLKSPLITISGFIHQLANELTPFANDKQKHRFARVIDNVEHLNSLLTNLLQLSRVMNEQITTQQIDTQKLIQHTWQNLGLMTTDLDIELELITPLHKLNANQTLFSQCLTNLLTNAVRYRKPNKPLKIKVHTKESNSEISLFICDNGIGIKKSEQERVFRVFEQVNNNVGNGVGLSIVKAAMDKHHGQVCLKSTLGAGSCFELRFPKVASK